MIPQPNMYTTWQAWASALGRYLLNPSQEEAEMRSIIANLPVVLGKNPDLVALDNTNQVILEVGLSADARRTAVQYGIVVNGRMQNKDAATPTDLTITVDYSTIGGIQTVAKVVMTNPALDILTRPFTFDCNLAGKNVSGLQLAGVSRGSIGALAAVPNVAEIVKVTTRETPGASVGAPVALQVKAQLSVLGASAMVMVARVERYGSV